MRIAFIHNLPSGGGKRSAYEFLRHLTQGHTIDLFHLDPASEDYLDVRPLMRKTVLIPGPRPTSGIGVLRSILPLRRTYARIAEQVNAGGYDAAFVMQCRLSNSPAVLRYLRVPSLYFCHEPLARTLEPAFWSQSRHKLARRSLVRLTALLDAYHARAASLVCANSRFSVESLYRAYGVYPRYSRLGVDTDLFHPRGLTRERVVLAVGALHPVKAQELIVEAVATLEHRPPIRFIFNSATQGYQQHLEALASRRGVSVSFTRLVGDADLVEAYNRAAVVAYPSVLEPFGFVPLEAMACGTPVVGVPEGGVRETVVDGETGFLAERSPVEFGRALDTILRSPDLGNRLGAAGRRHVLEHWTWEAAARMLEQNLLQLAGPRG